jgi:hypothetical protein
MKDDTHNELDWTAFCYAAGELSAAEAEQFEARLAGDQAAREALARAVELTQAVAAAETHSDMLVAPATKLQSDWSTRLSWMAVGGLAAVLLAMLWSGIVGPTWTTVQQKHNAAARQELAVAWNTTRREVREIGLWPATEADDDFNSELPFDDASIAESPSWMTAAVFGQADGPLDNPDQPGENNGEQLEN